MFSGIFCVRKGVLIFISEGLLWCTRGTGNAGTELRAGAGKVRDVELQEARQIFDPHQNHMYVCMHMHVYMYTCICVFIHTHMHEFLCIYMYVCVFGLRLYNHVEKPPSTPTPEIFLNLYREIF